MAFELRPGQGGIFPNKKKQDERHPDITGRANIDGRMFFISGWHKQSQNGGGYYSLSFKAADEAAQVNTETGEGQADDPGF